MTENTTDAEELIAASTETPDAAAGAADTPAAPESTPDSAEDAEVVEDQGDNPNKREARYRHQLREAQAERDELRVTVEALQRTEAERIAGESIQKPGGLWASGITVADLLDDGGTVDPEKVAAAVQHATETLGLAPTRTGPRPDPNQGRSPGPIPVGNTWEGAFRG